MRDLFNVQFHRRDGKPLEEYLYTSQEAAEQHFDLFHDDDSGLYTHIDLVKAVSGLPDKLLRQIVFQ